MVQCESGNDGNKSDNYHTLMLLQNPYSLRLAHVTSEDSETALGMYPKPPDAVDQEVFGTFLMKKLLGDRFILVTCAIRFVDWNSGRVPFGAGHSKQASSEIYADTFGTKRNLAVDQIVGQIRVFIDSWEPEKLKVPKEKEEKEVRNEELMAVKRKPVMVVKSSKQK